MLHRIAKADARRDHSVTLVWEDGTTSTVSFGDLVARGGVCAPMRDPDYFVDNIAISDEGYALAWPNEVEFSADSLWYKSHPEDARRDHAAE